MRWAAHSLSALFDFTRGLIFRVALDPQRAQAL
jgi:hypothetical protein